MQTVCRASSRKGLQQAKEALKIYERLGDPEGQASSLNCLAWLLCSDGQHDGAEEAASHVINLDLPLGQNRGFWVRNSHYALGHIYHSKGEREKAIHHYEAALGVTSPFHRHHQLFDDANCHLEQAKSYAVDHAFNFGRAMELHARIWYRQHKLEEAMVEALRAIEIFEKLGVTGRLKHCRTFLGEIEQAVESLSISDESHSSGELPIFCSASNNFPFLAHGTL